MPDPEVIPHFRYFKTPFRARLLNDGDALDLTGKTILAGIESAKGTAHNTTCFRKFPCTGHGTSGTLSGTIPATGISFTGPATLRFFASGPREFLGAPVQVAVKDLSANWLP